jgi:hypothetical protein
VAHWKQFFRDHQSYHKVGRVSHPPIDPSSPLPPHCDPKKDEEQRARWGLIGHILSPGHPAASAAAVAAAAAQAQGNEAGAQVKPVGVEPDLDARSSEKKHEEL